jgi:HK97 gp10 family phage protein
MSIETQATKNILVQLGDGRLSRAAFEELEATAANITEHAQSIVPVDTGELQGSIGDESNGIDTVTNYADAPHAGFVELGTRHQAAQPYMVPAFRAETEGLAERVGQRIAEAAGG